jgi:hypothetical protein
MPSRNPFRAVDSISSRGAVHDEAGAVLADDVHLAQERAEAPGPLEGRRRGALPGDDLQEAVLDRMIEEVEPEEPRGVGQAARHFRDGERGGVGGQDGVRFRRLLGLGEHVALDRQVLENGLDDQVGAGQGMEVEGEGHGLPSGLQPFRGEDLALQALLEDALDELAAPIEGRLAHVHHSHGEPLDGDLLGDAAAHGARSDHGEPFHAHLLDRISRG